MKRSHGSGHLYVKHGSYYGRWRGVDGRLVNKRIGNVRTRGQKDGITRADAERGLRRLVEAETRQPAPAPSERSPTVDGVADELRGRLAVEGARLSYRQNCESMQRVHVSPAIGKRRVDSITRQDVERLARSMLVDLLALYLDTGFNLGAKEFEPDVNLDVTGMSHPIDVWHYRSEAGMKAERPPLKRTDWWEACLTRVEQRRAPCWTEIGVAMCHVPPPEQREFLAAMHSFREDVISGRRAPNEFLMFHNGPEQRETLIVGIIATSPRKADRQEQMNMPAHVALQASGGEQLTPL